MYSTTDNRQISFDVKMVICKLRRVRYSKKYTKQHKLHGIRTARLRWIKQLFPCFLLYSLLLLFPLLSNRKKQFQDVVLVGYWACIVTVKSSPNGLIFCVTVGRVKTEEFPCLPFRSAPWQRFQNTGKWWWQPVKFQFQSQLHLKRE